MRQSSSKNWSLPGEDEDGRDQNRDMITIQTLKKKKICIRFTHQSVKILASLMQFPALTDPQGSDEILSPKQVN